MSSPKLNSIILTNDVQGPDIPLVMLHGWGHSAQILRPLGELITANHVHLIDLPGFGESEQPKDDWNSADYAQRILEYIDKKELGAVNLFGHSFGGQIALRLAKRYPEKINKLILLNASGLKAKRSLNKKIYFFLIRQLGRIVSFVEKYLKLSLPREWFIERFGSSDYKNAGSMKNILVKAVNTDLTDEAKKVTTKTLLLWGELDADTPLEIGKRYNELIPNSKLIVLSGKGHIPFLGAGAHLIAKKIAEFLDE